MKSNEEIRAIFTSREFLRMSICDQGFVQYGGSFEETPERFEYAKKYPDPLPDSAVTKVDPSAIAEAEEEEERKRIVKDNL